MNARLFLTAVLGGAIGVTAIAISPLNSAPAPEMKAQRWEYKVVQTVIAPGRGEGEPADKLTERLNSLAKDGWELVGPVVSRTASQNYLAFRRPKS